MLLFRAVLISFCCLTLLSQRGQCLEESKQNGRDGGDSKKDNTVKRTPTVAAAKTSTTTTAAKSSTTTAKLITTTTKLITTKTPSRTESTIYKIKRLDAQPPLAAEKTTQKSKNKQHRLHETPANGVGSPTKLSSAQRKKDGQPGSSKNVAKNSHRLNKKLLGKLGFTKVKAPNSHNRKRLAVESRRHASPDDSHMFIIKLPPNLYYYASPAKGTGPGPNVSQPNSLVPSMVSGAAAGSDGSSHQHHHHHHVHHQQTLESAYKKEVLPANGKKVLFPFSSNGKPGRIYHWNLPVIKKILEDKQRFPDVSPAAMDAMIDIKDIATWTKPWENETHDHKAYGKSSMMSYKKSLKRKSPTYYAPANSVNKNSFNKYFPGNGKPKGFYVIKENQKKPLYYKNIVS